MGVVLKYVLAFIGLGSCQLLDVRDAPEDRYIITFSAGATSEDISAHLNWLKTTPREESGESMLGVEREFTIGSFHAYSGAFSKQTIEQIRNHPHIHTVEEDSPLEIQSIVVQPNATWGLGAISHVDPIDPTKDLVKGYEYVYDSHAGEGTYAYVIDSGVSVENPDFEGRASWGFTAFPELPLEDHSGHGTHVAGTIASKTWGVAKKSQVIAVKVLAPNQGVMSHFMAGFEWAVKNITDTPGRAAKSVINLSLGGPINFAFNSMVNAASEQGVLSVVAAGNGGRDADRTSPASAASALTVAASAANQTALSWSNYGSVVDLYAPGVDVYSLSLSANQSEPKTGTSMASPHVAGLALCLKGLQDYGSVDSITEKILSLAKKGELADVPENTPNLLAFNGVQI